MKILAADHIANYQLKWATQKKISCEGCYTKSVEDNIFNNELHPETIKEYRGEKDVNLMGNEPT